MVMYDWLNFDYANKVRNINPVAFKSIETVNAPEMRSVPKIKTIIISLLHQRNNT